ncbi:LPO_1073/Vpar_1526 family protein [Pseudomonas quasicaspiana]|uniref:LPO_1073/Vpar_1526 family protein n=1 Tax=Pseudomonas quasicaspiana TaxID=2829821 RepID=UPI001E5BA353|nr:LPO_1073/Vpar_1526 family protein [Pseudomonas quasicaspiana]MCD5977229.1 hypothetical protein [Pseudomonas quasicaspiana]
MFKDQAQAVESGGTALQAAGDLTVNIGVTATEARNIALDVAKATFYELSAGARETVSVRVEEITDKVISKLEKEFPEGLQKAVDPDFQYALFNVQKQYGRTGDAELGDLLVSLLVDRCKQDERDILQIVLNESLDTAPKLTKSHLALLAVLFFLRYTKVSSINGHDDLGRYLDVNLRGFREEVVKSNYNSLLLHLEFAGCGSAKEGSLPLEKILCMHFPGLFMKGFDSVELSELDISVDVSSTLFSRCLNDPAKYQISALDVATLERLFVEHGIAVEERSKISALFLAQLLPDEKVRAACIKIRPYMHDLFEMWTSSTLKSFMLTSVGIAIGHAVIKGSVKEFSDLSVWIN